MDSPRETFRPGAPAGAPDTFEFCAACGRLADPSERARCRRCEGALRSAGAGQLLDGRYVLETVAGHGGAGEVLRALDLPLRRGVAVKFLADERPDEGALARFRDEAAALSAVRVLVIDGVETLSRLRDLPQGGDARVLVVSGGVNTNARWRLGVLGVTEFVSKPVDLPALVESVGRVAREQGGLVTQPGAPRVR